MPYEVTLPDGTTISSGSTDDKGQARVDGIDPGSCQISFPTLDEEAWPTREADNRNQTTNETRAHFLRG